MEEKYTGIVKDFTIEGNAWLHRNNHNRDMAWKILGFDENGEFTDPLGKGEYYISVGCNSRDLEENTYDQIKNEKDSKVKWNAFETACLKLYGGKKPKYRYSLWRFLFEFKQGDILLVPGKNKDFHVFKIISEKPVMRDEIKDKYPADYFDDDHDFHYFWKVEPVRVRMLRYMLADAALVSRMKIRGTTSQLKNVEGKDYKASLIKAVTLERLSPESEMNAAINPEEGRNKMITTLMETMNSIIDPDKFEELIKAYLMKKGADTATRLPKNTSGEKDADVEAVFEVLRVKVYVQAKKHDEIVDLEKALTQISEYRKENEEAGYTCLYWVIYSSLDESFAENYDAEKYEGIRVISGMEFGGMLLDAGIKGIDEAFYGKEA